MVASVIRPWWKKKKIQNEQNSIGTVDAINRTHRDVDVGVLKLELPCDGDDDDDDECIDTLVLIVDLFVAGMIL